MGEEAHSACKKLTEEAKGMKLELLKFLVPHDDADSMDAVLELRAGVGGGEAALWCSDMCSMCAARSIVFLYYPAALLLEYLCNTLCMYQRFCELKGWTFDIVSSASTESGGVREVRRQARAKIYASCDHSRAGCLHDQRQRRVRYAALRKRRASRAAGTATPPCARRFRRVYMPQVPATEKMGRVHTSTATVAVMPVPQENEVVINNSDLKIDT
jgi:peptide chain release factor 1